LRRHWFEGESRVALGNHNKLTTPLLQITQSAVDLLEPLLGDGTDFVRQGALIAVGMVLAQTSKAQEPRVEKVRKLLADTIAEKHEVGQKALLRSKAHLI